MSDTWSQAEAIAFCRQIHHLFPKFGCFIGLTGGCLYEDGERKDVDVLVYRNRQRKIDLVGLKQTLECNGITIKNDHGFCVKAAYGAKRVDFLFPDLGGNYYPKEDPNQELLDLIPT